MLVIRNNLFEIFVNLAPAPNRDNAIPNPYLRQARSQGEGALELQPPLEMWIFLFIYLIR